MHVCVCICVCGLQNSFVCVCICVCDLKNSLVCVCICVCVLDFTDVCVCTVSTDKRRQPLSVSVHVCVRLTLLRPIALHTKTTSSYKTSYQNHFIP